MKQYMVDLNELERFREGNAHLTAQNIFGSPVSIAPDPADPSAFLIYNDEGKPCRLLPRRGDLCKKMLAGARVGHISWQNIGASDEAGPPTKLKVRVVLVEEGEHFEMPPRAAPRRYLVGIVGEANYQPAIRACSPGQRVEIIHEQGNPYDADALAVLSSAGRTIGYVARDSWLRAAIHEEGKGCDASIKDIRGEGGKLGVVLDVALNGSGVRRRRFDRQPIAATAAPKLDIADLTPVPHKGWFGRLFGR
jgi:hypothetical protein